MLEVKSEDGQGSTFSLVLPAEEDQQGRFVMQLKGDRPAAPAEA
jgi:hypothetical protein